MLILAQRNQTSSTLSSTLTPCESWVEVRRWPPNPRFGEFSTLSSVRELFNVFLLNRRQFNSRDRTQFVKSGLRPSGSWIRKIGAWQIITKFYVFCKFQCSITSSWKNRRYFRTNLKIHLESDFSLRFSSSTLLDTIELLKMIYSALIGLLQFPGSLSFYFYLVSFLCPS